jgi:hypothetical protein
VSARQYFPLPLLAVYKYGMASRTRARRLADGQQLALLPTTVEEDGAQLDLVAEYGVETLSPDSLRLPELVLFAEEV